MAEFKVKALDDVEQKSKAQVEEELLKKHEEQFVESETTEIKQETTEPETTEVVEETVEEKPSFSDEDVLSHIKERYGKTINSIDELFEEREASEELPEDVAAYFKYKKETGRTIEDFVKLNRDFSKVDQDELLANYYKTKDEYLDEDDIEMMLEEFTYDEDLEEEKDIKKKKIAKKKAVAEAKKFFEEQKEQYKVPLESSSERMDPEALKKLEEYEAQLLEAKESKEAASKARAEYTDALNNMITDDFKGFEFQIDDEVVSYKPTSSVALKKQLTSLENWISKYTKEDGSLDHKGFYKSLAIANYPEKFAKFFYEKGKSDAVTSDAKKAKNIDLKMNKAPETTTKGGMQIKTVTSPSDGNRLRIRKRK